MTEVIEFIKKYGLYHQISRDLALFPAVFIGPAYTLLAKDIYGMSYRAVAVICNKGRSTYLLNDKEHVKKTEELLNEDFDNLFNIKLPEARRFFETLRKKIEIASDAEPKEALTIITNTYSDYWAYLIMYNSLMRYIGNEESKGLLTKEMVRKLAKERDSGAKIYPVVENIVIAKTKELGKELGFDGNLIRYMGKSEIKDFLEQGTIDLEELKKRAGGCVYLFDGETAKEHISSDEAVIDSVNQLFMVSADTHVVQGHTAHPGKIKGTVLHLTKNRDKEITKEHIIVASNTFPTDTPLIAKAGGLITDEGGILSHAAVISREMGIPCVMGTKIASKVFKDGDLVELDATKGVVKIIKRK